jgi:hypothetical protein
MRNKAVCSVLCFCVALVLVTEKLAAQVSAQVENRRIGTAAATEITIPVGARDLAMGGAGMATSKGIDALHWNPAGLGRISSSAEALVTTMSYIADIRLNYGAVGVNFGSFGVVGLSVRALDFGDIPMTTQDDPEGLGGRTFSPAFITVGLSYSRAFTDAITAGGTVKFVSEKMARAEGSGVAFDLGVQYHQLAGIRGLHMGVALKNIGSQMSYGGEGLNRRATSPEGDRPEQYYQSRGASYEFPTSVELGLTYERGMSENVNLNLNGAFASNNLGLDGYRGGAEVLYKSGTLQFAGRGGMEYSPTQADDDHIFGPTFGFGVFWGGESIDLTLDYAYRSVDFFDSNNMFTLKFGF